MAITKRIRLSDNQLHENLHTFKRRKTEVSTHPNWASIHPDLLDNILQCLEDWKDKIQVKHTCSSWLSVTKSHIHWLTKQRSSPSPMFMISGKPDQEDETEKDGFVFSLEEKLEKPLLHDMPLDSCCIGSSGAWLFLLRNSENLLIFHPIFGVKISLPPIQSLSVLDYGAKTLSKHFIKKSILLGDPLENDFGVAVICGRWNKLAFSKKGDTNWTEFAGQNYADIIYHKGSLFALTNHGNIEQYMVSDVPRKVMKIKPSLTNNMTEFKNSTSDLYSSQYYIVESRGDLLMVVRCIGNFVYGDGEVIREDDLIDEPYKFSVCPYKTTNFYIYKLNFEKTIWEELAKLDDQMLFVGGNQSFSLSAKNNVWGNENSIYFTDDNWDEITMAEDEEDFGGHDMGIFHLTDRRFEDIYFSDTGNMEPAFWIL